MLSTIEAQIPAPIRAVLRGVGQVFFQENALSGACFLLGISLSSPIMALGGLVGAVIGTAVARLLKFDASEISAGIYGFNATLVGIASFFFFQPGAASVALMVAGCVAATVLTHYARRYVPFPTYTAPFVITTWVVYFAGKAVGAASTDAGTGLLVPNLTTPFAIEATMHGVGQVMFQASIWTAILFLVGIALNDRRHAAWVLFGAFVGMLVAQYHVTMGSDAIDPERLIKRTQFDTIRLGLYGYNATLAPIALYLWRRSLIAPLLGMLLAVFLTDLFPAVGLPALTAPFVVATWIVLLLKRFEALYLDANRSNAAGATESVRG